MKGFLTIFKFNNVIQPKNIALYYFTSYISVLFFLVQDNIF
jgi:hypothetical protein